MRTNVWLTLAALLLAWTCPGLPLMAQPFDPPEMAGGGRPQVATAARPVIYRLSSQSTFLEACFDPCDCITHIKSDLDGTMILSRRPSPTPLIRLYDVSDVNFRIHLFGADVLVRGSGTYEWRTSLNGFEVLAHRLILDLRIGESAEPMHLDSELIAGAQDGVFPPINIVIDVNNQSCYDQVLTIDASPISNTELVPYDLDGATYQIGCFDPCDCPLSQEMPVSGAFALVPLGPAASPVSVEYAVVRIRWSILGVTPQGARGSGFYTLARGPAADQHRLQMGLTVSGGPDNPPPEREWDSGWVALTGPLPPTLPPNRIDIDTSLNGFFCFDEAFYVRSARP